MKALGKALLAVLPGTLILAGVRHVTAGTVYVDPANEFVVSAIPGQDQYNPEIWGNTVVWTAGIKGDVWAKNTGTGATFFVGEGTEGHPNIHDGTIVWAGRSGGMVWAFDVETRERTLVASGSWDADPDVYGSLIVWSGGHIKNLATGWETVLPGVGDDLHIFGDNVVWIGLGMQGYRLSSGISFEISPTGTKWLGLHGNILAWRDGRNGNQDIYGADITDPYNVIEFPVCTDPFEQGQPAMYGNIIVWHDYRNGDIDVYGYDITTDTEFPIATGPGNQFAPDIYGNLVVWSNEVGDQTDIHANYIIPEPYIPEPVTVFSGLIGLSMVGAYLRRRKGAAL